MYNLGYYSNMIEAIFNNIKNIPKQGVYILKNLYSNTCFINYSSNIPSALVRNIDNYNLRDQYSFEVLEIVTNKELLRLRCQYYKDFYSNIGYDIINSNKVCKFKIAIEVVDGFHAHNGVSPVIAVKVVSRGHKELIVGIFNAYRDADKFIAANYSDGAYNIVYADNDLTKEFLKNG